MDAVEYLRQKKRMCRTTDCRLCPFYDGYCTEQDLQTGDPEKAVEAVSLWAAAHPVEPGITLTAMERRFVAIYIEKGYIWAARDKSGELNLYKMPPKRGADVFRSTSATVNGSRTVMGGLFPAIKWDNSPVCLPKLLEDGKK